MKNSDTKHSLGNASVTDKPSSLIDYEQLEGTPFLIVSMEQENSNKKEHFGAIGKVRITEMYETKEKAIEETVEITWDRIVQVMTVIIEEKDRIKKILDERGSNNNA